MPVTNLFTFLTTKLITVITVQNRILLRYMVILRKIPCNAIMYLLSTIYVNYTRILVYDICVPTMTNVWHITASHNSYIYAPALCLRIRETMRLLFVILNNYRTAYIIFLFFFLQSTISVWFNLVSSNIYAVK